MHKPRPYITVYRSSRITVGRYYTVYRNTVATKDRGRYCTAYRNSIAMLYRSYEIAVYRNPGLN